MKLLLKRDDQTESAPHADQLDVGELAINTSTGKLYSKLTNGSVVEWISQKVCFEPVPVIVFDVVLPVNVPVRVIVSGFNAR